jgi:hypothetical protein
MLTDGVQASVSAGATVNIALGRPVEFIGRPSLLTLLMVADGAGMTHQVLVNVGGEQMAPVAAGTPINVAPAAGQGPRNDEDVVAARVPIPAGARLQINVTNTNASGTVNVRYRAILEP